MRRWQVAMKIKKAIQVVQLLRGAFTAGTACAGPFFVSVDVTQRCNLRCIGCRFHSPEISLRQQDTAGQDVSYELVLRLCDELKSLGGWRLIFIGQGEPLLHPRLVEMIAAAKAAGLEVFLISNGTLLGGPMAAALVASGLDRIQVSLWASSREEYERNHPGTPGTMYDKVLRGLDLVAAEKTAQRKRRPYVVLHHPLGRNTHPHLERFAAVARAARCDAISFGAWLSHRGTLNAHGVPPEEEAPLRRALEDLRLKLRGQPLQHNIAQVLERYESGGAVWRSTPCYIGWIDARVQTNGTVVPCGGCSLPVGNVSVSRLADIWNGPAYRDFRQRTRTCQGLEALGPSCDCEFCCHLPANRRLHSLFRLGAPFARRRASA